MSKTIDINVKHVTRIEGHGNIVLKATDGKIEKLEWQVPEAPRFFEAMIRGRNFQEIQIIVSRICGICSISHSLAAVKAVEDAMGVQVSDQSNKLRMLMHYGEQFQSHILHVGYLVAPDLLGAKSVVPLASSHPDAVKTVVAVHRVGTEWTELLAGRTTHPVSLRIGGFGKIPTEDDLKDLKKKIVDIIPKLQAIADLVLSLAGKLPSFDRPTEYIALVDPGNYPFYHGQIGSTDTSQIVNVHEWESVANEYVNSQSTAKWTKWHRDAYAVGALARFNLNADKLMPLAAKTAKSFGLKKGCCNPYMNSVAQVIEAVQVVESSLKIIDELLATGLKYEVPNVTPKAGVGVGAVEAPRGILFHRYAFDDEGRCLSGNICIPTNQNHGNIQKDFEALVPQIINKSQTEITLLLEMLVRSYDPCVSCSTHFLDVKFV